MTESWSKEEKDRYNRETEYPEYFPKPWQQKESRSFSGQLGCDYSQEVCIPSYFELFINWDQGKGVPSMYDPRLKRNMEKYPDLFSKEKVRERLKTGEPSPHVPSPGIAPELNPDNLPAGKYFLDPEDKAEWHRLKNLYSKFKIESLAPESEQIVTMAQEFFLRSK